MYIWEIWARENVGLGEKADPGTSPRICQGCLEEFAPRRKDMVWCGNRCRSRAAMRAMRERRSQLT